MSHMVLGSWSGKGWPSQWCLAGLFGWLPKGTLLTLLYCVKSYFVANLPFLLIYADWIKNNLVSQNDIKVWVIKTKLAGIGAIHKSLRIGRDNGKWGVNGGRIRLQLNGVTTFWSLNEIISFFFPFLEGTRTLRDSHLMKVIITLLMIVLGKWTSSHYGGLCPTKSLVTLFEVLCECTQTAELDVHVQRAKCLRLSGITY